jgi:hypothetical protein
MTKYLNIYRIILKTFGFKLRPLGTFGLLQLHGLLNGAGRAADHLFYPDFKKQPSIGRSSFWAIRGAARRSSTGFY